MKVKANVATTSMGLAILILFSLSAVKARAQAGCDALPPASAFTIEKIADAPYAPYDIQIAKDGRVFWLERQGDFKVYDPATKAVATIGTLDVLAVNTGGYAGTVETGLEGLLLAPDFETSHWVYLFYAVSAAKSGGTTGGKLGPIKRLSRFTLTNGDKALNMASEKPLYQFKVFAQCCHFGGAMDWGPEGDLYLSTGDNIDYNNTGTGIAQAFDSTGENKDPRNTSANTNDPRGKVLRIKPILFPDTETPAIGIGATYTIPAGNLKETWATAEKDKVLPEIFSMGHRNPFTISVNQANGWVGVGEANGDRDTKDEDQGDDEINVVTKPGYFGWPFIIGDNQTYVPSFWRKLGYNPSANAAALPNNSKFNSGAKVLPPAVGSVISQSHGGMLMPLYCLGMTWGWVKYDAALNSKTKWPPYLAGKLLVSSYGATGTPDVRVATIDANGKATKLEVLFTGAFGGQHQNFTTYGMRARQGPDGAFYLGTWDAFNYDASTIGKIFKVSYTGSCSTVSAKPSKAKFSKLVSTPFAIVHLGSTEIELAEGIRGAQAFNLDGTLVWETHRAVATERILATIPASVPRGMLQIRYTP